MPIFIWLSWQYWQFTSIWLVCFVWWIMKCVSYLFHCDLVEKIPNLATFYDIVNRIIYGHFHRTVIGHILADMDLSHFWRIHCHFDWSCTWILKTGFKDILKLEVPMYLFLEFTNSMKNVTKQVKKTSSRVNSFWKHRAVIFETFARK